MTAPGLIPLLPGALTAYLLDKDGREEAHVKLLLDAGFVAMPQAVEEQTLCKMRAAVAARVASAEGFLHRDYPEIDVGTTLFAFQVCLSGRETEEEEEEEEEEKQRGRGRETFTQLSKRENV